MVNKNINETIDSLIKITTKSKDNSTLSFKFDIHALMDIQSEVIKKYKFPYERKIVMLDRFSVQILEEVQEFTDFIVADGTLEDFEGKLFELIDLILYTGSLLSTYKDIYEHDMSRLENLNIVVFQYNTNNLYDADEHEIRLNSDIRKYALWALMASRMEFPERKYHKIPNKKEMKEIESRSDYRDFQVVDRLRVFLADLLYSLKDMLKLRESLVGSNNNMDPEEFIIYFSECLSKKISMNLKLNS